MAVHHLFEGRKLQLHHQRIQTVRAKVYRTLLRVVSSAAVRKGGWHDVGWDISLLPNRATGCALGLPQGDHARQQAINLQLVSQLCTLHRLSLSTGASMLVNPSCHWQR